jgi:hypothetical protein
MSDLRLDPKALEAAYDAWPGCELLSEVREAIEPMIRAFLDAMRTYVDNDDGDSYRLITAWHWLDFDGLSADVDELARIAGEQP